MGVHDEVDEDLLMYIEGNKSIYGLPLRLLPANLLRS